MLLPAEDLEPAKLAAKFINLTSRHVFLTGKAGTGKTTFLRNLISLTHKQAVIVAPTGIAAINAAGVTIHSLFQLPFGTFLPRALSEQEGANHHHHTPQSLIRHLTMNNTKRRILQHLELLVIDEVSMLRADLLDAVDVVLRHIRKNNSVFGGVQLLFIGDLHQLPPVVKPDEWRMLSNFYKSPFFFESLALAQQPPVYIELEKIYRQNDERFIHLLNNLRNNQATEADISLLKNYYRENYEPSLKDNYITLTTHNHKADLMNKTSLTKLSGKSFFYDATVEKEFSETSFPAEKRLELKIGAQVMFIKNDPSGEQRFFNGKIGKVTKLTNEIVEVQTDDSKKLSIEKYTWKNIRYNTNKNTNEIEEEVAGTFTQFPLKLAWAITVHKSQGLTFDKAVVDIGSAFAPGQIYVALSRLRSLDGLILTSLISNRGIKQDQHVALFSKIKHQQEELSQQIERESNHYLRQLLMQSFDLAQLDNYIFEHVFSYAKSAPGSFKQQQLIWATALQEELTELKIHANNFVKQIGKLFVHNDFSALHLLLERTIAAENYFTPRFEKWSAAIFEQIEVVKQEQNHDYLEELVELEAMFYEQIMRIAKAKAMLESAIKGVQLTKQDVVALHSRSREEKIKKAYTLGNDQQFEPSDKDSFRRLSRKPKSKVPKKPKVDTKELTLTLLKEGKNIKEIAKERGVTESTIEGHLAFFVARQEISAGELIPPEKLKRITAAIVELKSIKLGDIRAYLGNSYGFGEIKIAVAAYLADN